MEENDNEEEEASEKTDMNSQKNNQDGLITSFQLKCACMNTSVAISTIIFNVASATRIEALKYFF